MAKEFNNSADDGYTPSQMQIELLQLLLEPGEAAYPWNTTDPNSEVHFANREQEFALEDWSEAEIATRSQAFFTQLEEIWSATDNSAVAASNSLQDLLIFAADVPQGWLEAIAARASQVLKTQQSIEDSLVQCVQELLPNWAEADLLVLARFFADTMRGTQTEAIASVLDHVRNRNWTTLSEIEQARASLAIAKYALTQYPPEGES